MNLNTDKRTGATLIVTLGVLTLLATMAVTFLVATRIRQRTTTASRNLQLTRDAMDAAMQHIVRQIEDAMVSANCAEETGGETKTAGRRLVPVNRWFNDAYLGTNDVAEENEILPQIGGRGVVFLHGLRSRGGRRGRFFLLRAAAGQRAQQQQRGERNGDPFLHLISTS